MSYILDALKKLEQKRKQESFPDILTVQEVRTEEPKRRPLWPYLLAAGLLLNAALLLWWLRPWHPADPGMTDLTADEQQPAAAITKVLSAAPEADSVLKSGDEMTKPLATDAALARQAPVPEPPPPSDNASSGQELSRPAPPPTIEPKPQDPGSGASEQEVVAFKDLPPSVQKSLPELRISAFLYSANPRSRMVRVNDRLMHEGQETTEGLKLDEITPDGLIFSYRGHRFRVKVL